MARIEVNSGGSREGNTRGELFRPNSRPQDAQRLPWVDADGDEEDDAVAPGVDPRRALAVLLGGAALLAVLGGGLYWMLAARSDIAVVADGSLIAAPAGPYKVRPTDPGGTRVSGSGDVSFAVAEGVKREGHIAGEPEGPSAGPDPRDEAGDAGEGQSRGGIGVQIGAFPSRKEADLAWASLATRVPVLEGRGHRVIEGSADAGSVFRLQAVAGGPDDARALCQAILAEGGDCQVKD